MNMLSKGNSNAEITSRNLIKTYRGEVPYDRIRGIDGSFTDKPISKVIDDIDNDVRDGITSNSYYISAENAVIENNNVKCVIKSATGTTYNYIAPVIGDKVLCITKNSLWGDSYSVTFNKTVPGTIVMYLLCKDGVLPNQSLVESIEKVCNSNSVRCFNDKIIVRPAVPYEYKINVQCYINPSDDIENIKTEIKKSVEDYKKWQGSKIGRNINKDKLQMYVMQAGAYKVSVGLPSHKVIKDYNVAVCTDIKIGFVVEEES